MMRPLAWRCISRRGHATWHDPRAQRRIIYTTRMPARLGYHPHRQPPRRSYSQHVHVETEGIANEPARHGRGSPELDVDWPRDERWNLSVAEQEAQFQVHKMGQIWGKIMQLCAVCHWPHSIANCPLIFEHSPIKSSRIRERRIAFQERMEKSQELYDTVMYLRTKFTRRLPSGNLVPLPRSTTLDAPPLARGNMNFPLVNASLH